MGKSKHDVWITTPPVEVIYTYTNAPDEGRTHNGRPISDGKYKVSALLDAKKHKELIKQIGEVNADHHALALDEHPDAEPYNLLRDHETEDGKKYLLWTPKSTFPVTMLNGQNEEIEPLHVGWGSVVNLKVKMTPTKFTDRAGTIAGSTCYLNGLRILKLVSMDNFGEPVSDGFSGGTPKQSAKATTEPNGQLDPAGVENDDYRAFEPDDSGLPF